MIMQMVMFDEMGVPQLANYDPNLVGNSTAGWAPFIPNQSGPSGGNYTNPSSLNDSANGLLELANLHNTLLVGGQLVASGTGDNTNAQLPTYVVNRPWVEPPEGSVPFDPQIAIALPAVAATAVIVALVVPDGYDGVINAYSWNITGGGFVQGSGDLQVQMLRNGAAIRNYDNILVEKGTISTPRPISPLRVYSGQAISLVINHVANGLLAGNVIGCFSGYFYPSLS
jgi:hypothetical protein